MIQHKTMIKKFEQTRIQIEKLPFGNKKKMATSDYVEILLKYEKNKNCEKTLKDLDYLMVFIETW